MRFSLRSEQLQLSPSLSFGSVLSICSISIRGIPNWHFIRMHVSVRPSFFPYHSVPILRNKLTRWTFYVWYLLRARLGSGFIESYIKASGPEKARGVGRLARTFESTDRVLAFVSSGVHRVFSARAVSESALNFRVDNACQFVCRR